MKDKIKKFIQNNTVKTIGVVLITGAVTYIASQKALDAKMKQDYDCYVYVEGYDLIKIEDDNEI